MIKLETTTAYDVPETAKLFGCGIETVRRYIKAGKLRAQKVGRNYYVTEETIKEFLNGEKRK